MRRPKHESNWRQKLALIVSVMVLAPVLSIEAICEPLKSGSAPSTDAQYLDALAGRWEMSGTLGGKVVHYNAQGDWVLQHAFLRLHMEDANTPPQYEADVYLGYDAKADDYVVHWLDRFGAAGARVVADGKRKGDRLIVIFPYAEGAFRDTFTLHKEERTWDLLLESQETDGSWTTFAQYVLSRRP